MVPVSYSSLHLDLLDSSGAYAWLLSASNTKLEGAVCSRLDAEGLFV